MKKLLRTMVVAPLYLFTYGAVLVWSFTNPFWGFLALAALDLVGIGVVVIIGYRVNSVHGWATRRETWSVGVRVVFGLLALTILHLTAAYLPSGEAQTTVGYLVPLLPVLFGIVYLLMEHRPDPES